MHAKVRGPFSFLFSKIFFIFKVLSIYYLCVHCCCLQTHQKGALDSITDGCEPPCGCWELNSGPLEEQSVLLTTKPLVKIICSRSRGVTRQSGKNVICHHRHSHMPTPNILSISFPQPGERHCQERELTVKQIKGQPAISAKC